VKRERKERERERVCVCVCVVCVCVVGERDKDREDVRMFLERVEKDRELCVYTPHHHIHTYDISAYIGFPI